MNNHAPTPTGSRLFGQLTEFRRDPIAAMARWQADHGDLVRFRLANRTFHLFSHPELAQAALIEHPETIVKVYDPEKPIGLAIVLGQGLITSQGALWRQQRGLMQPMFRRSRIATMAPQMTDAAEQMLQRWAEIDSEQAVDVAAEMMRLTLEVISQTMFSTTAQQQIANVSPAFGATLRYVFKSAQSPLLLPRWIPTAENRAFNDAVALLDQWVYQLIAERRGGLGVHKDLLERLITARDQQGNSMSDQQLRDEVLTIFTAGHETTANALSWCWHLLSQHSQFYAPLQAELDQVLAGRTPTAADLSRLPYCRAVLQEAMRLYPPAPVILRRLNSDLILRGYRLEAGTFVFVNLYTIHRHPDFWPEPDRFDPDRFINPAAKPAHPLAYMPFGAGPRARVSGNNLL